MVGSLITLTNHTQQLSEDCTPTTYQSHLNKMLQTLEVEGTVTPDQRNLTSQSLYDAQNECLNLKGSALKGKNKHYPRGQAHKLSLSHTHNKQVRSLSEDPLSATNSDRTESLKKINRLRYNRMHTSERCKSEVLDRNELEKTGPRKNLAKVLQGIKTAFMKFQARHQEIHKQKTELKKASNSSVYNSITIFTQNAISNNIKIFKDEPDPPASAEASETSQKENPELEYLRAELLYLSLIHI
eukprot:TRINITY_DN57981_c0_g1_i1.p1 TRINITY_DN57981_c0_g1~~TRINITY_DN57981_c0_g1_i1.p1  ORF type:complete len:242 (-),score=36.65 TRINITY_DN57981_c0_g1_i1:108-833(-)